MHNEIGARKFVKTSQQLPQRRGRKASEASIGGGHSRDENQSGSAPSDTNGRKAKKKQGAKSRVKTRIAVLPAAPISEIGGGQKVDENHVGFASSEPQGEGQDLRENHHKDALADNLLRLTRLQWIRKHCIVSQSRADRSLDDLLARMVGYSTDLEGAERKALFGRAKQFRGVLEGNALAIERQVERRAKKAAARAKKGLPPELVAENEDDVAPVDPSAVDVDFARYADLVIDSWQSRRLFDKRRDATEAEMCAIAETFPGYEWVSSVRGFGIKGFAVFIAETGDLSKYATKEKVWKRLGLAVINGQRQQKMTGTAASDHKYDPERRSEVWAFIDTMFRHQWAAAKDEDGKDPATTKKPVVVPAHPKGPYGEVYRKRKERVEAINAIGGYADQVAEMVERMRKAKKTPPPENLRGEKTRGHIHNDARRVMSKFLVEQMWRTWNGKRALEPNEISLPRQDLAA